MTAAFNKREFARFIAARFNVSQDDGTILFDEIGKQMSAGLAAGGTVFVFGLGTLKTVKSKGVGAELRTRFRPTSREDAGLATVTLQGLPGLTQPELTDVIVIRSASGGVRALQAGRPCTVTTGRGTITLYRDHAKKFRCILDRANGPKEEAILHSKTAAGTWLKQHFPVIAE